jgi:hypothetical protein
VNPTNLDSTLRELKEYCARQALAAEEQADRLEQLMLDDPEADKERSQESRIKRLREIAGMFRTVVEDV